MNAGDQFHARSMYHRAFSDGRGEDRIGRLTAIPVERLKEWLASPQARRPFANIRFANDPVSKIEPTWHPKAERVKAEILAHEARLQQAAGGLRRRICTQRLRWLAASLGFHGYPTAVRSFSQGMANKLRQVFWTKAGRIAGALSCNLRPHL